jgi:hypothetical protein
MQALDNFIIPIPGFDDDIPVSIVLDSIWHFGDESISNPSTSALKTWAGKLKATSNLTPLKNAKKAVGTSVAGIKINNICIKTSRHAKASRDKTYLSLLQLSLSTFKQGFSHV